MSNVNFYNLALETYNRLLPEINLKKAQQTKKVKSRQAIFDAPALLQVLQQSQPLPDKTIVIGWCPDGLPFLFDLNQPDNGSVLVTGDPEAGSTRQLQVMVESAVRLYSPRQVQVAVISAWHADWEAILTGIDRSKYCRSITNWYDRETFDLIADLVSLAEDRRNGRRCGAQVLLVIDGLNGIQDLDYTLQVNLHWLLEYGPQSGIWPVVSLDAGLSQDMKYWVDAFRTRLLGHINSQTLAQDLAIYDGNRCPQLVSSLEFTAWIGSEWITYLLPELN
jgi:hypothetical protein